MKHVEREGEVYRQRKTDSVRLALMQGNPRLEGCALDLGTDPIKHAGLQIDCDDATGRPDQTREFEREEARATTDVEGRHAFANIGLKETARVLKPPAKPVVEPTRKGDRAHAIVSVSHVRLSDAQAQRQASPAGAHRGTRAGGVQAMGSRVPTRPSSGVSFALAARE
jgi:hypothetical protein